MIRRFFAHIPRAVLVFLAFLSCSGAWAAASVSGLVLDSSVRSGRTTTDFTYRITVANTTPALGAASATVVSNSTAIVVLHNSVTLGSLAAGSTTTSVDTFTIRVNRTVPFNPSQLAWTVGGTPQGSLPNVLTLTQAAAAAAITSAGFVVGTVTTASSATVPAGSVISQNPASGTTQNLGSAVNLVVSTGPANVSVPNVVNLTQAAATTAITGAGLVVGTVTTAASATVAAGSVISQNPVSGASVALGSAVNLVVSTGPANVNVPNVVGLTQAAATTAITGAGLVLGTVTTAASATVAAGSVISQNPPAATSVSPGSGVNLVVSTGAANVSVPNVVNLTQAAATTAITGAGLVVGTVTTAASATVAAGSVISQNPPAATSVSPGSGVNIVVSAGPANVNVPNVVGLTRAAATTAITGVGLVLGTVTTANSNGVPAGNVISQNPVSGASVALGSAVNLVVSTGPANVNVPNVVGLTQAAATTAITGAGLVLGTVTTANSNGVPVGSVISQNPVSGTSVAPGSAVNLVISVGPLVVVLPNVVGLTQNAATGTLTAAGFSIGTVSTANSNTVVAGNVISQNPAGGASVSPGIPVDLVVSIGPAGAVPTTLKLTLNQQLIDAGNKLTVTWQVLDGGGNVIALPPSIDFQVLFDAASTTGVIPNYNFANVNNISTGADTRGTYTLQGTVHGTAVTASIQFAVLKNDTFVNSINGATELGNQMLYVSQAAAQVSMNKSLQDLATAVSNNNSAAIAAASAALTTAAAKADPDPLSFTTPYAPDVGFVPTTAQLAGQGVTQTAADIAFGALNSQVRTKIQQITSLLNSPSANQGANDAALAQYLSDLQTLANSVQLAANTPGVYGLVANAQAVNDLLSRDMPLVLQAIVSRVNGELHTNGLVSIYGAPLDMYHAISSDTTQRLTAVAAPNLLYGKQRPAQFLLGGLINNCGIIGTLITKIYVPYMFELQTNMIVLGLGHFLQAELPPGPIVQGIITGAESLTLNRFHLPGSLIEISNVTLGAAQTSQVYLVGGAQVNALKALAETVYSLSQVRSMADLNQFYNNMTAAIRGAGNSLNDAHQQPDSFDFGGDFCLIPGAISTSCVDMSYNQGFNFVGQGGPSQLSTVLIIVKSSSVIGPGYGVRAANFIGN